MSDTQGSDEKPVSLSDMIPEEYREQGETPAPPEDLSEEQEEQEDGEEVESEEQEEPVEGEEAEAGEAESDEDDGDEPEPKSQKPDTSDLMDKQLQQFQQLTATLEKKLSDLPDDGNPTERQVKAVEKAKSKIDKYLDEADIDPYSAVPELTQEILSNKDASDSLLQEYEAKIQELEKRDMRREAEQAQIRFAVTYPELKGQYNTLVQKAYDGAAEEIQRLGLSPERMDASDYNNVVNAMFVDIAERESKAVKEKSSPDKKKSVKDSAKKPKATNIINPSKGNKEKPPMSLEEEERVLLDRLDQGLKR